MYILFIYLFIYLFFIYTYIYIYIYTHTFFLNPRRWYDLHTWSFGGCITYISYILPGPYLKLLGDGLDQRLPTPQGVLVAKSLGEVATSLRCAPAQLPRRLQEEQGTAPGVLPTIVQDHPTSLLLNLKIPLNKGHKTLNRARGTLGVV